jgi:hypothetical protein
LNKMVIRIKWKDIRIHGETCRYKQGFDSAERKYSPVSNPFDCTITSFK